MKNVIILGSTGSIGTNSLKVIANQRESFNVVGLAAGRNTSLLAEQAKEFSPQWVYAEAHDALAKESLSGDCRILGSQEELCQSVCAADVDIVLCAIVGTAGLRPVLNAIKCGKDIALASKEVLVMAGNIVTKLAAQTGSKILPVDSEHCAIFQCLEGNRNQAVNRIILTCSGGPFREKPELDLSKVTLAQTLKHPTWSMGRKITIDSATLMNKGLEMMEAAWLFGMKENQVDVVVHPQSIVHSMVEYVDGSILAQMGYPDMCLPIHYCLNYPTRVKSVTRPMNFRDCLNISFEPPDTKRFPALDIARQVLKAPDSAGGAIFNAANEVAVASFIDGKINFDKIAVTVDKTLNACGFMPNCTLEEILEADTTARRIAAQFC